MNKYQEQLEKALKTFDWGFKGDSPCGCGCSGEEVEGGGFIPVRLQKAFTLSLDPALIMLVLGQSYVMSEAQKRTDQFLFLSVGSMINLVLFNLSSIDYDKY